jgi:hypothetical protein
MGHQLINLIKCDNLGRLLCAAILHPLQACQMYSQINVGVSEQMELSNKHSAQDGQLALWKADFVDQLVRDGLLVPHSCRAVKRAFACAGPEGDQMG